MGVLVCLMVFWISFESIFPTPRPATYPASPLAPRPKRVLHRSLVLTREKGSVGAQRKRLRLPNKTKKRKPLVAEGCSKCLPFISIPFRKNTPVHINNQMSFDYSGFLNLQNATFTSRQLNRKTYLLLTQKTGGKKKERQNKKNQKKKKKTLKTQNKKKVALALTLQIRSCRSKGPKTSAKPKELKGLANLADESVALTELFF